jgi:hypothetical protein
MFAPGGMNYSASFSLPEYQPHLERRPSMSWRPEVGLPPPPSEIDRYQNLHHALVPSSTSYRGSSPSSYDLQFGGEVGPSEAMNTVTKHPKLKLKIVLSSSLYEAGGSISGSLEVTSSTSQRLRLGEIAIELEAFEGGWPAGAVPCQSLNVYLSPLSYTRADLSGSFCYSDLSLQPDTFPRRASAAVQCCASCCTDTRPLDSSKGEDHLSLLLPPACHCTL